MNLLPHIVNHAGIFHRRWNLHREPFVHNGSQRLAQDLPASCLGQLRYNMHSYDRDGSNFAADKLFKRSRVDRAADLDNDSRDRDLTFELAIGSKHGGLSDVFVRG